MSKDQEREAPLHRPVFRVSIPFLSGPVVPLLYFIGENGIFAHRRPTTVQNTGHHSWGPREAQLSLDLVPLGISKHNVSWVSKKEMDGKSARGVSCIVWRQAALGGLCQPCGFSYAKEVCVFFWNTSLISLQTPPTS